MVPETSISEVLRRAVLESGLPLLRLAQETGIQRASLSRFVRGKNSLRLDVADKLAAYFGLRLTSSERTQADNTSKE
ncbi:addiction module antidote protein : Marine sediment metagenome DNA, contig: S01H1_S24678 OS=marine sediment metagenome GN=S01H1_60234 PE=4 SV=1: HTH_3 [Gemmata massiliana]|uniref:HTH cro/C1-type domain-containing protein n=1 Tax=Gemmata massiliana TaxID=1210884 RepID=A0A6P2CUT7_9BACT|nr:helix-turn-helix transcriptional regulator [Gemmata massiliana]VTR92751.1 addiction module antidote protein : Marine sediment metagenome DNA, contig: S01H1_S24678 OS=marine sediment metagenome GN=S01H1_60234 PE=4 SV=1: HTH_3 [Gemmata massiliana]